ncbi:MAG: hypothetical protein CMI96_03865 [Pelagibacteraceae bacterium]|nr:hypothetical protein [Pelagibacteraceae bacterium]|tara:strand:+ start:25120 stop:26319 length:1200 start_codon:yes stop_codon:yes gene_type:complete
MDAIKENFLKHIENGFCNGAEWKIISKNNVYHDAIGFRDLNKKKSFDKNLFFRIWSMTKPIICIATMQLVDKNYLSLDDTIDKYLPQFKNISILNNNSQNINETHLSNTIPTIRQLLLHTAGFTYNNSDNIIGEEYEKNKIFHSGDTSLEEEIDNISKLPLLFEPGSKWHYSVSIDILARILEIITKDKLINILKENIFNPLDMNSTDFFIEEDQNSNLVETFEFSKQNKKIQNLSLDTRKLINYFYPLNNRKYSRGGHGLFSTAEDYSKFTHMLIDGKNITGKELISFDTLTNMRSNNLDKNFFPLEITSVNTIKDEKYINDLNGYGWGLGFRILMKKSNSNPYGIIGEFGWSGYASTYFLVDPVNQISAVLMMQIIEGDRVLKQDFYNLIFKNLDKI